MSYVINIKPVKTLEDSPNEWFVRTYQLAEKGLPRYAPYDVADRAYEQCYNVKLIYDDDDPCYVPTIVGLEFESKFDAILFLLRWGS